MAYELASAGVDLLTGGINAYNQYQANKTNERIAQENIKAQKEINAQNLAQTDYWNTKTMEREDNAIQRASKDAQLAGLSKTLGIGGASASQLNGANLQAPINTYKRNPESIDINAVGIQKALTEIDAMKAQTKQTDAQTAKIEADTEGTKIANSLKAEELSYTIFENDYWRDKKMPASAQNKYLDAINAIEYVIDRWFSPSPTVDADVDSLLPPDSNPDSGTNAQNTVNTAVTNPELHEASTSGREMAHAVQNAEPQTIVAPDGEKVEIYGLSELKLEPDFVVRYGKQAVTSCTASDAYFDYRDWVQNNCSFKDGSFACKNGDWETEFATHAKDVLKDLQDAWDMSPMQAQLTLYIATALELN